MSSTESDGLVASADAEVALESVVQACEPIVDYTTPAGIDLFFDRLHSGWWLDAQGELRPPKGPA